MIAADEDAVFELHVAVRNTGNCEVDIEARVLNNLGEELLVQTRPGGSSRNGDRDRPCTGKVQRNERPGTGTQTPL